MTMPLKRIATEPEIDALAKRFRALWVAGDVVRPWLRKHADMLLEIVHDDGSWDAVARALTKAGITYRTGRPWTAGWLQSECHRARIPLKGYFRKRAPANDPAVVAMPKASIPFSPEQPEPGAAGGPRAARIGATAPGPSSKAGPRFKPVSIRPPEARPQPTEEELAEIEQNRRLTFGRS